MVMSFIEARAESLSHTGRILGTIKDLYSKLANPTKPFRLGPEQLADLMDEYSSILAKPTASDSEGIINLVKYAAPRMPAELFNLYSKSTITFNSDPSVFTDPQDGLKKGVRSAPKRSRWFKVEKDHITMHAESQTAVIETMVHLSVIERMRLRVREILQKAGKKSQEEIAFIKEVEQFIHKGNVKSRLALQQWASKSISIEASNEMVPWDMLKSSPLTDKESSAPAAFVLAEQAHSALIGENQPSMLFFSNSHSLPNILSHYLLSKNVNEQETVQAHIVSQAQNAYQVRMAIEEPNRPKTLTPLEDLGEAIAEINGSFTPDQKRFAINNLIIYYLTKIEAKSISDTTIQRFITEYNSPDRLKKCGIKTLIEKDKSSTADPLHYIDFNTITPEVMEGISPLYKDAIEKLQQKNVTALFLPYAPGDLTYSIIVEMKRKFKSLTTVAEVGKVAHAIHTPEQRKIAKIGELVVPNGTLVSYGSVNKNSFQNNATPRNTAIFGATDTDTSIVMEAPSVILQDGREINEIVSRFSGDLQHKTNIAINMEAKNLQDGAFADKLNPLDIIEIDYFSDHAYIEEIYEQMKRLRKQITLEQITHALDRKGVFGVHAATAGVLVALANKV